MKTKEEIRELLKEVVYQSRDLSGKEYDNSLKTYTDIFYNLQYPQSELGTAEKKQLPEKFAVRIDEVNEDSGKVYDYFDDKYGISIWDNEKGYLIKDDKIDKYKTRCGLFHKSIIDSISPIFTVAEFLSIIEPKPTQSESEIEAIMSHQQPNLDPIKYPTEILNKMTDVKSARVVNVCYLIDEPQFTLSTDLAKQLIREKYNLPEDTIIHIQNPK